MARELLWRFKQFQFKVEIISNNPNPDKLKKNIVYVVGGETYIKWAYLKCPCGCNEVIMLSLDKTNSPSWSVKQDNFGRATISPSVNKLVGCRSHFLIKKGKLIWANDSFTF